MPRIVAAGQAGGGVQNWYQSLPPITRTLASLCFITSLGCYVGLLKPFQLALLRDYLFQQYEVGSPGVLVPETQAGQHPHPRNSK